jgi:hypothetical protein
MTISRCMRTLLVVGAVGFATARGICSAEEKWEIPWEAAKGEHKVVLPYQPVPLDKFLLEIPAGHEEANRDRKEGLKPAAATVKLLATFRGRSIFQVVMEVEKSYYNRYYFIVAEVEEGRYMALFAHQYAFGTMRIEERVVRVEADELELAIVATGSGRNGGRVAYKIATGKDFRPRYVVPVE